MWINLTSNGIEKECSGFNSSWKHFTTRCYVS